MNVIMISSSREK